MAKNYYNDYKSKNKEESKIFTPITRSEDTNTVVINGPVTINNETNNEVNIVNIQEKEVTVYCNVRKAPNGEIQTTYQSGTKVKVVEEVEGWSKLDNGLFIRSDLLK